MGGGGLGNAGWGMLLCLGNVTTMCVCVCVSVSVCLFVLGEETL